MTGDYYHLKRKRLFLPILLILLVGTAWVFTPSIRSALSMNIRFSMEEHVYNSLLYLLSALLQADAAILSLGSIFFIFKMQSLDSQYQFLVSRYQGFQPYAEPARILKNIELYDDLAKKELSEQWLLLPQEFKGIMTIPMKKEILREGITHPVWMICLHIITCAITLFCSPALSAFPSFFIWLACLIVLWFSYCIYLVGKIALEAMTLRDVVELKKLNEKLSELRQRKAQREQQ
jgi:hypothetical protein